MFDIKKYSALLEFHGTLRTVYNIILTEHNNIEQNRYSGESFYELADTDPTMYELFLKLDSAFEDLFTCLNANLNDIGAPLDMLKERFIKE